MVTTYVNRGVTWIDLESPTKEEISPLAEKYKLHPLVVGELLSPSDRPKVDLYENLIYLILHFPTVGHTHGSGVAEEVDFIIGKDFIITTHYETVDVLYEFGKRFEVDAILHNDSAGSHAGLLFFSIVQHLYASLEEQLQFITNDLQSAKKRIFKGEERAMVERLSHISREVIDFRIALKSHGDIWLSFEKAGVVLFGQKFSYYLGAISGGYTKIWNMLEGNREMLGDLRDTNDSLLTTKMNETMVHLTMMAFVVFPLTLIAGIFAMGTRDTPILGTPYDFWKVVAIMGIATMLVFSFFRYRKWL